MSFVLITNLILSYKDIIWECINLLQLELWEEVCMTGLACGTSTTFLTYITSVLSSDMCSNIETSYPSSFLKASVRLDRVYKGENFDKYGAHFYISQHVYTILLLATDS